MLLNKCYITARYKYQIGNFIVAILNNKEHLLYIGNFKHTDKILDKLKNDIYFNAICRIRRIYEPEYPQFNSRITPECQNHLSKINPLPLIWLEAVKITTLPEGKLYPIKEKGYFSLQDTHKNLFEFINTPNKCLTETNCDLLIKTHGNLSKAYILNIYRVLSVKGGTMSLADLIENNESAQFEKQGIIPEITKPIDQKEPVKKFGNYQF